jgi:7-cyano-7-deazaguanine synthase
MYLLARLYSIILNLSASQAALLLLAIVEQELFQKADVHCIRARIAQLNTPQRFAVRVVSILSGGMDSTLACARMRAEGHEVIAVHFDYKQRTESKEREAFHAVCDHYGIDRRYVIPLDFFKTIGASALTDEAIGVPKGAPGAGVPITYVPFRNGIFLALAAAIAEKEEAEAIVIGAVEEDSSGYPDCRESFLNAMQEAINHGTKEQTHITLLAPLVHLKKEQIVTEAARLKVPMHLTWSCYEQSEAACGECESCHLRLKGFKKAGLNDPIAYAK